MRYLLFISLFIFSLQAEAATFKSVKEVQYEWIYEFMVKPDAFSKEEPLDTMKGDCAAKRSLTTGKLFTKKPINCFDTEAEARAAAQKEANDFEKKMTERRKVKPPQVKKKAVQ